MSEKNLYVNDIQFVGSEVWDALGCETEACTVPPKTESAILSTAKTDRIAAMGQLIDRQRQDLSQTTPENAIDLARLISKKVGFEVSAVDVIEAGVCGCIEELLGAEKAPAFTKDPKIKFNSFNQGRNLADAIGEPEKVEDIKIIGTRKEASIENGELYGSRQKGMDNEKLPRIKKQNPAKAKARRRSRKNSPKA
jgi:hypothetical protein